MEAPLLGERSSHDYGAFPTEQDIHNSPRPDRANKELLSFCPGDPDDPRTWTTFRKWSLVIAITAIDLSVSWGASGYSPASTKFAKDMNVGSEVATLGLSLYVFGLAFGPMSLAPLSEYVGRSPIYIVSYGLYICFLLGTALVESLGGFLAFRFLSGLFSAVTIANFGGTIADIYHPHDTGPAMSIFLWAATGGSPSGYFLFSWVAQYRPWRDVFWALFGVCGGLWIIMAVTVIVCGETRHSTILRKRAAAQINTMRNGDIDVSDVSKTRGWRELFQVALTRPFRFLATEAIIIFAALYNGYLYGLSFLFNGAFPIVFGPGGHDFNISGVGTAFLGIFAGITLGPITNIWQERYYKRRVSLANGANVPEARVQMGKLAALMFPISLFWFAWTSSASVHYIVPILASALWGWSFYTLILMTYTYAEDSYKTYSASALAGIGLIRNLAGGGFPLFGSQLFRKEGSEWAGTILAFLACILIPIPFILDRYGKRLRQRSPWAREHLDEDNH